MILIAINNTGYENLLWLLSNAQRNNFYYKPRIWDSLLANRSEGLIATTGCLAGKLCRILEGPKEIKENECTIPEYERFQIAKHVLGRYADIFNGRLFLEIQDARGHKDGLQERHNNRLIQLSKELGLPLIITSDAHYLKPEDVQSHSMLMALQLHQTVQEYTNGDYWGYVGTYIRSQEEMLEAAIVNGAESAFHNTKLIAEMSDLKFKFGEYQMPNFDIHTVDDKQEFLNWLNQKNVC